MKTLIGILIAFAAGACGFCLGCWVVYPLTTLGPMPTDLRIISFIVLAIYTFVPAALGWHVYNVFTEE